MPHSCLKVHTPELDSKLSMKRHVEKFRRHFWLRRACYALMLLAAAAFIALMGFQPYQDAPPNHSTLSLPTSMIPYHWQRETKLDESTGAEMLIEDVVNFGSEVLFLVQVPPSVGFPNKERLQCRYGGPSHFAYRKVLVVHLRNVRAAVVCSAPPEDLAWDVSSVLIKIDKDRKVRKGKATPEYGQPLPWNSSKVVYEVFPMDKDMVVFAHGINHTLGIELPEPERLNQFQCVYGGHYETAVTAQAQEVFRCGHPPEAMIASLAGKKLSLRFEGKILPSFVYYNPLDLKPAGSYPASKTTGRKLRLPSEPSSVMEKHHICSCTMIYNGAKFLKEWVYYHSHLGVEKFYLYDNNSEDNLDEVIASLASFNVTKQSWPWVKTQEAGFSHCSLLAQPECTWMLYTDVDEYFFPSQHFSSKGNESVLLTDNAADVPSPAESSDGNQPGFRRASPSILATFVQEAVASREKLEKVKVGQISTYCNNYGPSGLKVSPPQGVTQGYTCRIKRHRRHKSFVLLSSIADSLSNQIHHFTLKPDYQPKEMIKPGMAIINHYKFQVWDEFKTKFHRRAATYVADWNEDRNHASNDRVPGLGIKAVKPADWESRYCEVQDYGLRDYTRRIFGSYSRKDVHLAWE